MSFYLKGVHIPHFKNTTNLSAVKMTAPKYVSIPTSMHIGAPATPIVKVGDSVKTGTLIAEQNGYISSPVYSSISGTVTEISDMLLSNGKTAPIITRSFHRQSGCGHRLPRRPRHPGTVLHGKRKIRTNRITAQGIPGR